MRWLLCVMYGVSMNSSVSGCDEFNHTYTRTNGGRKRQFDQNVAIPMRQYFKIACLTILFWIFLA